MVVDWAAAASKLAENLFNESFELYEAGDTQNDIGESILGFTLIDTYKCNIQNSTSPQKVDTPGVRDTEIWRVSTFRTVPVERGKVYYVKLISTLKDVPSELQRVAATERTNMSLILTTAGEGP